MSRLRPFRFGVICEQMQSAEEWVTKARQAEDYGYATFLIRDHFIKEFYFVVSDANMEAFVPIAARLAGEKRR